MSKSGGQRSQIKSGRAGAPIVKAGAKGTGSNPVKGIPESDHTERDDIVRRMTKRMRPQTTKRDPVNMTDALPCKHNR